MNIRWLFVLALPFVFCPPAQAEPFETEIPNVTAELIELSTDGAVTRLLVRYANSGSSEAQTARFEFDKVMLVDVESKQKHFPLRDADGRVIGGPIGDAVGGGRAYVTLPAGRHGVLWAYFEPLPVGTRVSVELPQMFPFEDASVSGDPSGLLAPEQAGSVPAGAAATLISAKRASEVLKLRLKLAAEPGVDVDLRSPYFEYQLVYLFDPVGKRRYPLMKDSEGIFQASPIGQAMGGGTFLPNWSSTILMSLTFPAPPDDVSRVDLMLADFLPMVAVTIEGLGGATAGGVAAAGKSLGLEAALKELDARVTPEEIRIDLDADVLFDFDQADLKPAAAETLRRVVTVAQSRPSAAVAVEGHTDTRGDASYNQALSQRRAESVRDWLTSNGIAAQRLEATGAGESRPLRSGSTEADHQANRRVEIRIRGS